jgi:hypothetical protein
LRRASSKSKKFVAIIHTKEAKENVKIIGNIKVGTKEEEIVCKPFLLSVSKGAWTTRSEIVEVFFKEEKRKKVASPNRGLPCWAIKASSLEHFLLGHPQI